MCRLLAYVGPPLPLGKLLLESSHSLVEQSYQPQEMTSGILNADGYGFSWYDSQRPAPYVYRCQLPIWSDTNLPDLASYVKAGLWLAYVRSATPGSTISLSNCQPFTAQNLSFVHNGLIKNFRETLYRPLRNQLDDASYKTIQGTTDSEHFFALIQTELHQNSDLLTAVQNALQRTQRLAKTYATHFSANFILSDGKQLIATRYASQDTAPSLYWLRQDSRFPDSTLVASEPLFDGDWEMCPTGTAILIRNASDLQLTDLS